MPKASTGPGASAFLPISQRYAGICCHLRCRQCKICADAEKFSAEWIAGQRRLPGCAWGETRAKPGASKTKHCWPDVLGLQVTNHAKTGQYGPQSYCVRKVEIEINLRS